MCNIDIEKDSLIFRTWWNGLYLSKNIRKRVRSKFLRRLQWSERTWFASISGTREIKEGEKRVINIVAQECDFNKCFEL